jgi:hypothetical protein
MKGTFRMTVATGACIALQLSVWHGPVLSRSIRLLYATGEPMNWKFFKASDLKTLAAWICFGFFTCEFGAAFCWMMIAPFYLLVLLIRLVMLLFPQTRAKTSFRLMWIGPAVFLMLLPVYVHRFNAAREAGDRIVEKVEAYRHLHGVYPISEKDIGLEPDARQRRAPFYDGSDGKPVLFYASPLIVFDIYSYDFDKKMWVYVQD